MTQETSNEPTSKEPTAPPSESEPAGNKSTESPFPQPVVEYGEKAARSMGDGDER
jgi:hypothetical protein